MRPGPATQSRLFGSKSPESIRWRHPDEDRWTKLISCLDRLGRDLATSVRVPPEDKRRCSIAGLFAQVYKSFRAAVILADRGFPLDANAVLRSAVEAAIAMHALRSDPCFMDSLIGHQFAVQQKLARVATQGQQREEFAPEMLQRLDKTAKGEDANVNGFEGTVTPIIWEQVAARHCKDLYLAYRVLSTTGAHLNLNRVADQIEMDAAGSTVTLKIGPTTQELEFTLCWACMILLVSAREFVAMFGLYEFDDRLRFQLEKINELSPKDILQAGGAPG
ncbi:MAG: hypothetical protein KGI51_01285 [Rhodospirillales bacterium]|nr:hypothetical protein [Rhodospirillales bacterium]